MRNPRGGSKTRTIKDRSGATTMIRKGSKSDEEYKYTKQNLTKMDRESKLPDSVNRPMNARIAANSASDRARGLATDGKMPDTNMSIERWDAARRRKK